MNVSHPTSGSSSLSVLCATVGPLRPDDPHRLGGFGGVGKVAPGGFPPLIRRREWAFVAARERVRIGRPPSEVDGRTVRDRLLLAATTLFAERGFDGTSVQDVVALAGVTKGAMYHYFASKEDLLYEIYVPVLTMQLARLQEVVAGRGPVALRLHTAAADIVATSIEHLLVCTLFYRSEHHLDEDKRTVVRRERRRYHETFRGMIEEGQRSGVFRADVDADLATHYYFGSVHHLPVWYRADGERSGPEIARWFADLFLASLVPDAAGATRSAVGAG